MKPACANCQFCAPRLIAIPGYEQAELVCRRYPPRAGAEFTCWPDVQPDEFCGEFRALDAAPFHEETA